MRQHCCIAVFLWLLMPMALAQSDARVLLLNNGRDPPRALNVTQLREQAAPIMLTVDDIEYGEPHTYEGLLLQEVLRIGAFRAGDQLLLVCSDGYSIPFDSAVLEKDEWQGLIALRDIAAAEGTHFVPFAHGREAVDFSPFYLVWTPQGETASTLAARDLPWPYQLTEIRVQRPEDFAAAMPPESAGVRVKAGFDSFYRHCIKCHAVNGSGGTLGLALDSAHGLDELLQRGDVVERITNISRFYAGSKMPDFGDDFSAEELDALVGYLQSVAER